MKEQPSATIARVVDIAAQANMAVRVYLFGSASRHSDAPGDLDILIVYPNGWLSDAMLLADALRQMDVSPAIDVLALCEAESEETNFIAAQGAVLLWESPT